MKRAGVRTHLIIHLKKMEQIQSYYENNSVQLLSYCLAETTRTRQVRISQSTSFGQEKTKTWQLKLLHQKLGSIHMKPHLVNVQFKKKTCELLDQGEHKIYLDRKKQASSWLPKYYQVHAIRCTYLLALS
jgi:hypothetical protein